MCEMELFLHSYTSTVQPGMWLLIHAGIKVKPYQ